MSQIENSGSYCDYYLCPVEHPQRDGQAPYIAECEDIIQALGLTFDEACEFKSIWRRGRGRQGFQKAESTALRDASKALHYARRVYEFELRKSVAPKPQAPIDDAFDEARADVIGQNGNDAEIYHHLHKHGHRPKSGPSPTYVTWTSMKARCENENSDNYALYGGRGISVCKRWSEFTLFLADMGERPADCTIDRVDPDGNYEPGNCRWASSKEQAKNKRGTIYVDFNGFSVPIHDLAESFGVPTTTIYRRHKEGRVGADLVTRENLNAQRVGSAVRTSKLTEASVATIKRALLDGEKVGALSIRFGVSQTTISGIKAGKTWKHVMAEVAP